MRILANSGWLEPLGGVETSTAQDVVALAGRGHQVSVMYGEDGALRSMYEQAGVELSGPYNFMLRPRHPVSDLRTFLPATRHARAEGPDVVWLNRVEHLYWGLAVSRWSGAPLVCHLHGLPVLRLLPFLSRGVAQYVAVSDFVLEAYVDRGISPERITRLYNAISPDRYPVAGLPQRRAARTALGLPQDRPIVLCYGQLSVPKGALTLFDAWRRVVDKEPEAYLVLVDSASQDPDPDVMAALGRLDPASVRLFPITTDVAPFLQACDVVAFPTWLPETFGRVVLEGMATGRPVVASRVGAVPEVLRGPMSRFLVEPRSAEQLAAALVGLLDWPSREPGLLEACARWVQEHFPFEAHVDGLESVLAEHARATSRRSS
jgi:glycosyltransferase involved in cell wall biosynthesis